MFIKGNIYKACNACVSTSMALCVWPCNCYEKDSSAEPDLMWNLDMYARLDMADAWAIIAPHNWYAPTSNIKLMFDRLVCNGGNPNEKLIKHKDPLLASELEHSPEWEDLSINHLGGRSAGIFCYGDGGGDEFDDSGRPKKLIHKEYFDQDEEPFENGRDAYAPVVWQCRYSGIEVPDQLWEYCEFADGKKYIMSGEAYEILLGHKYLRIVIPKNLYSHTLGIYIPLRIYIFLSHQEHKGIMWHYVAL